MLPTFMPVATQAAIKGLTAHQMESLGVTLILNNTYHLNLRPGMEVLNQAGGAHKFQGWDRNLLTVRVPAQRSDAVNSTYTIQDSGGFQLVSLSKFTTITEEGALFASPFTGEPTMLTVGFFILLTDKIINQENDTSQRRVSQSSIPLAQISSCSWTMSVRLID